MIFSMTGFARTETQQDWGQMSWELAEGSWADRSPNVNCSTWARMVCRTKSLLAGRASTNSICCSSSWYARRKMLRK